MFSGGGGCRLSRSPPRVSAPSAPRITKSVHPGPHPQHTGAILEPKSAHKSTQTHTRAAEIFNPPSNRSKRPKNRRTETLQAERTSGCLDWNSQLNTHCALLFAPRKNQRAVTRARLLGRRRSASTTTERLTWPLRLARCANG